jgi:CheY-like chemotaxis protein
MVQGNESRLGQVFLNLLVNAVQAIPSVGQAEQHEIRVRLLRDPEGVRVVIQDTGQGIPPEVMRRLFTPFFSTKPVGVGTGLGLSICRRIIENHHGDFSIESAPGHGTTVSVVLPLAVSSDRTPPQPSILPSAPVSGRVLVIDDEPIITTAVRRILSKQYQIETTQEAQTALEWIAAGRPFDLILCDLMMPQMSGMDFFEALQQRFPHLAPRVFFLTGGAFTPRTRAFLDSLPGRHLEKPFQSKALLHFVGEQICSFLSQPDCLQKQTA